MPVCRLVSMLSGHKPSFRWSTASGRHMAAGCSQPCRFMMVYAAVAAAAAGALRHASKPAQMTARPLAAVAAVRGVGFASARAD